MKKYSVLLADDDEEDLDILQEALQDHVEHCTACTSLGSILEKLNASTPLPDIIVCDFNLQQVDAVTVCRTLSTNGFGSVPFVVLSGTLPPDHILQSLQEYHVKEVLVKPVTPSGYRQLASKLEDTVEAVRKAA